MKFATLLATVATAVSTPELPVEQYQLDNGLTVLLSQDETLPVVATEVLYLVGSAHEAQGRTGFAHLFEHLMFQGSKNFDKEYFQPYESIGGHVNGTTNRDRTNYFERVPANYLELPLWMESERMENLLPALDQQKLDNQRDVVKNERRQRYENEPYGMFWWHLGEMLYPKGHPYRHATIGSHEDLSAATLDDVRAFFQRYYVPANAVLTVVGDFEKGSTKALIEKYFGHMPSGTRAPAPEATMPTLSGISKLVVEDDVNLPRLYLAWHSPALYEPGDAELDLFSSILSDGKSSRLFKPLVYDQKVAKDVHAYQVSQKLSSFYVVQTTAAPGESIEELYTKTMAALEKALAAAPSEDELERAKNNYKKSFYGRIETAVSRATTLGSYYLHTGNADYLAQDLARYTGPTAEGVHDAAKRWIDLKNFVRIDFVPRKRGDVATADGKATP
jgi:zinc protease